MDQDSLYFIFAFLKVADRISFSKVCSLWRHVYDNWFDLSLKIPVILYQNNYLNFDAVSALSILSKKHRKISNHLLNKNQGVRTQWIKTHKGLCCQKNFADPNQQKPLINLISELGIGIWIDVLPNNNQWIKITSLWGQEIAFPIQDRLFRSCLYHHHSIEGNLLILHSLKVLNDEIVTFVLDCSDIRNLQLICVARDWQWRHFRRKSLLFVQ